MDKITKQSAQNLGLERGLMVCGCLRRFGVSNAANISLIAGVNRLRYADELAHRGFIIKCRLEPGHADRYGYILSDKGRLEAEYRLDKLGDWLPKRPQYTLTEHRHLPMKHYEHDMTAQELVLRIGGEKMDQFDLWRTEWEERLDRGESSCADAVESFLLIPELNGSDWFNFERLHEIELNQKTNARLRHWLGERIVRLIEFGEGRACCCIWFATEGMKQAYVAELKEPLHQYYRNEAGALVVDQSKPLLQAEPWMFKVFVLDRDERGMWHPKSEDVEKLRGS